MHIVLGLLALLILVGLIIQGLVYLVIHFWWLLLLLLAGAGAWLYFRHPGVRAKREMRDAVKQGQVMREDIRATTDYAKAEMERITRDWEQS